MARKDKIASIKEKLRNKNLSTRDRKKLRAQLAKLEVAQNRQRGKGNAAANADNKGRRPLLPDEQSIPSGKAIEKAEIDRLKAKLATGGLTQSQINNITNRITQLGGKVNVNNFPVAGSTDANPDAKKPPKPMKDEKDYSSKEENDANNNPIPKLEDELAAGTKYGEALGQKYYSEGALGRIDAKRTEDQADVLARQKALLGGLTDEEIRGIKEAGQRDIGVQVAQARRQVIARLAQTGARGNAAAAALGDVERQRITAQAGITQDLLNRNVDLRRSALQNYAGTVGEIANYERSGQQFNLGQQAAEVAGRSGAEISGIGLYTGTGSALRGEQIARENLEWQKKNAKKTRKHQLKLAQLEAQTQLDIYNQSRADAEGGF